MIALPVTSLDAAMTGAVEEAVSESASLRFAAVTAVDAEAGTVDVSLSGAPIIGVPLMEGAAPSVGGTAWLLHQGALMVCIGPVGASKDASPVGMLAPFAGSVAPTGWLLCDGASYSSSAYPALYDVIGTTYGGTGTQFNVPDMRDRFPMGASASKVRGTTGGTATINKVVAHSHAMTGTISLTSDSGLTVSGTARTEQAGESTGQNHGHIVDSSTMGHTHATDTQAATHGHTAAASSTSHSHGGVVVGGVSNTNTSGGGALTRVSSLNSGTSASDSHSHTITVSSGNASHSHTTSSTSGWGTPSTFVNGSHWHSLSGTTSGHSHTAVHSLGVSSTGDSTVDVTNPYLAMNYIIKAA